MKIIAEIDRSRVLVEAEKDELANLIGFYYAGQAHNVTRFSVGTTIKVHEMYQQLQGLANARRELKATSQTLHSIANLLFIADPLIQAIVEPDKGEVKEVA